MQTILLNNTLLSQISELISVNMGLHFPEEKFKDLERGLSASAKELQLADLEIFANTIVNGGLSPELIELLAKHLTISETYFFRDPGLWEDLEKNILPEIIKSRKGKNQYLRLWVAASSTGEEAYSLAILLNSLIPNIQEWDITILATDINIKSLNKARKGAYTEWSFRRPPVWLKSKYFSETGKGAYAINPDIMKMVRFSSLNLVSDEFPAVANNTQSMDIILCRNALMYFKPHSIHTAIKGFYNSLVDGGHLIVSPVETSHIYFTDFIPVNFGKTIYFLKDTSKSAATNKAFDYSPVIEKSNNYPLSVDYNKIKKETKVSSIRKKEPVKREIRKVEKRVDTITDPYQDAYNLYIENRFFESQEILQNIEKENPNDTKVISLLSRILANQGQYKISLEFCERAINLDKVHPEYPYLYGIIIGETGNLEEAVKYLKRALYLDHNYVLAHFNLGNIFHKLGNNAQSKKHYSNCINILQNCDKDKMVNEYDSMKAGELLAIVSALNNMEQKI